MASQPVQRTAPSVQTDQVAISKVEQQFLAGCLSNGASTEFCGCMANGLQTRLSTAEFAGLTTNQTNVRQAQGTYHAVSKVTEGCTIPLQLTRAH